MKVTTLGIDLPKTVPVDPLTALASPGGRGNA